MTILVITDLHDRERTLPFLNECLERFTPDAVFCLGDLTEHVRTGLAFTERFLEIIDSRPLPLFCISGNNDVPASLDLLRQRDVLIDYQVRTLGDTRVVGMGYGDPTEPFNPDLRDALLLTHLPPRRNSVPDHVTNVPRFHFAGHFHSRAQIWKLNRTRVVQVPSAMDRRAALLRLPQGWVEFISLP